MKLPGEAWLEFKIEDDTLIQEATFRPSGVYGRLYWYVLIPFHFFIFNGMIRNLAKTHTPMPEQRRLPVPGNQQ